MTDKKIRIGLSRKGINTIIEGIDKLIEGKPEQETLYLRLLKTQLQQAGIKLMFGEKE